MRTFLLSLFLIISIGLFSQINCHIYPGDTTVCYKSSLILYTEYSDTLNYKWSTGETSVLIEVEVKDTTKYYLTVTNKDSTMTCFDSILINTYPKIAVEFEQVNKGCPGECKAQVIARASDGMPPYRYLWSALVAPNDSSLALGLCGDKEYSILVKDTLCSFDTSFLVESYDMPEITLTQSPDSLFSVNPQATFSFENKSADSIPLTNWVWKFTDGTTTNDLAPTHVFNRPPDAPDTVKFIYTTIDGCVDTLEVYPVVKAFKLTIPNVFTPNGDGANDKFEIPNIEKYITNSILIYNRWGQKVFEFSNYKDQWDGGTLPDGVYFYVLKCNGYYSQDVFKGSITLIGRGR